MKKIHIIILGLFILSFTGLIWADSNGIWHRVEDIQGGTFGSEEQDVTTYFKFINLVQFDDFVEIKNNLNVTGKITTEGNYVATLDNLGKVPLEQLPFHKGDIINPVNRPLLSVLLNYNEDYFNLGELDISGNVANNVLEGISFGPGNQIIGGFSKDNVCSSAGGNAQCGMTSYISPGSFYTIIGQNSPGGTNYCNLFEIGLDGSVNSSTILTAGTCTYIESCNSTLQITSNYPTGTSCGTDLICVNSGLCVDATGTVEFKSPGIYSWQVPLWVNSVKLFVVAGGGGIGSDISGPSGGSGGGGGAYVKDLVKTVVPGENLTIIVGAQGPGNSACSYGSRGGTSSISGSFGYVAMQGGQAGSADIGGCSFNSIGGPGGSVISGTGNNGGYGGNGAYSSYGTSGRSYPTYYDGQLWGWGAGTWSGGTCSGCFVSSNGGLVVVSWG